MSRCLPLIAVLALLSGCASSAQNDPLEPVNRAVFSFNLAFDDYVLEPVAKGYRNTLPQPVQVGIRNAVQNLREPRTAINALLQGNLKLFGDSLTRFLINSTFGIVGIFDVAGSEGVTGGDEDFGQTLGVWGVSSGPYLMLPLLGPSDPRDLTGRIADTYGLDPVDIAATNNDLQTPFYVQKGLYIIDKRARNLESFDAIKQNSVDLYAKVRSLYAQQRDAAIANGAVSAAERDAADREFDEYFAKPAN